MHAFYSVFDVDLSYGIYLLHYPVLLAFFKLGSGIASLSTFLCASLAIVSTVALACFLAHAVEIPMIKLGRHLARRREFAAADCPGDRDFIS